MTAIKILAIAVGASLIGLVLYSNFPLIQEAFFNSGAGGKLELAEEIPLNSNKENKLAKTQSADLTKIIKQENFSSCSFGNFSSSSSLINPTRIIFNEIAWMGSKMSAQDEWIELKNVSGDSLNISGWQILDKDEQINFSLPKNAKIEAGEFYILTRSFYSGNLKNSDEGLRLYDSNCNLVDEAFASPAWPAGDNETKKTMERGENPVVSSAEPLSWHTSRDVGGTPGKENSKPAALNIEIFKSSSSILIVTSVVAEETPQNPEPQVANHKILISEIFYDAEGGDTGKEFIELYNNGPSAANLGGWSLLLGDKSLAKFGIKTEDIVVIKSQGYLLIGFNGYVANPPADIKRAAYLPNTSAVILLVNQGGAAQDSVSYNNSVSPGQSWERTSWASSDFRIRISPNPQNSSQ